jgi:glycosyltransferase involved in cell wall biosynthesis
MARWHLITGEYPPQLGGVADYTRLLARELARAGDEVHVWAPAAPGALPADRDVAVHRLPDRFGPRSLAALDAGINTMTQPHRLLIQYVPHAFGWKAMNVPFCLWLLARRRQRPWVMFHEVAFPIERSQPLRHNFIGWVTRRMAKVVTRSAERIFVSIPAWKPVLQSLSSGCPPITWLPVPSNVATNRSTEHAARVRSRITSEQRRLVIGHFGTFGAAICSLLWRVLPPLLAGHPERVGLLIGRGGDRFAGALAQAQPTLRGRLVATGTLPEEEIPGHLAACDILVQPYPDGVSSRRTSLMAGLALGVPMVTTLGPLSESLWRESCAVALAPAEAPSAIIAGAETLLRDQEKRDSLGRRARSLYRAKFGVDHVIRTLRCSG